MRRTIAVIVAVSVLLAGVAAVSLYQRVTSLRTATVSEDVDVIFGQGGNVGVLATERGAVVVDTMTFRLQGERIRELAEALADGPVQAVINTHYHLDHTHGNPAFAPGTRVIATQRTRDYMMAFDGDTWQGAAAGTAPNDVFEGEQHELRVGGKTIRSYHLGPGHTGGDLVVLFVEDRVLHAGDLFFHRQYPNIDLEAGGSVRDWIATLDRVLELDFDAVIPGHGAVTDREGLLVFQAFLRELWEAGETAAREGRTLEQTLGEAELRTSEGWHEMVIPFVVRLDRDFVVRRVWQEATGAVTPAQVPVAPVGS